MDHTRGWEAFGRAMEAFHSAMDSLEGAVVELSKTLDTCAKEFHHRIQGKVTEWETDTTSGTKNADSDH